MPHNVRDFRVAVAALGFMAGVLTSFTLLVRFVDTPPTVQVNNVSDSTIAVSFDHDEATQIEPGGRTQQSFGYSDAPETLTVETTGVTVALEQPGGFDLSRVDVTVEDSP